MKKWIFFVFAFIVLSIALSVWFAPSHEVQIANLPWKIEKMEDGGTKAFGLHFGQTTLQQFAEQVEHIPDMGLFVKPDGERAVEAFFGKLRLGIFEAKVIARLKLEDNLLNEFEQNQVAKHATPSGAWKYELSEADLKRVYAAKIGELVYVPVANYDEALVKQRFGDAQDQVVLSENQTYWLYPDNGLALLMDSDGKELLQYFHPQDYAAMKQRIDAEKALLDATSELAE